MAFNPFIGQDQATLEAWLADAQADLAAGKTISQAAAGDVSKMSMVQMTPLDRIMKLLAALNLLDPDSYPASAIAQVRRTRLVIAPYDASYYL